MFGAPGFGPGLWLLVPLYNLDCSQLQLRHLMELGPTEPPFNLSVGFNLQTTAQQHDVLFFVGNIHHRLTS